MHPRIARFAHSHKKVYLFHLKHESVLGFISIRSIFVSHPRDYLYQESMLVDYLRDRSELMSWIGSEEFLF